MSKDFESPYVEGVPDWETLYRARGDGHEITPDGDTCTVCEAIDKAEARLREVTE